MIKGKASYPFETIALAVDFSSRLNSFIAETKRLAGIFNARTVFIHPGKRTTDKEKELSSFLIQAGFNDSNCVVHWQDGNQAEVVLNVCKQFIVDLLIIDTMVHESMKHPKFSFFLEISRKAKCSVLMMMDSSPSLKPIRRFVVNGHIHDKTIHTLKTALYVAAKEGVPELILLDEPEIQAEPVLSTTNFTKGHVEKRKQPVSIIAHAEWPSRFPRVDLKGVSVKVETVAGKSHNATAVFARTSGADLLFVNSPDHHLTIFDRVVAHDLEYLLADLHCNTMLVHSRVF